MLIYNLGQNFSHLCKHIITCYSVIVNSDWGTEWVETTNGAGGMEVCERVF
jgi:hypothetical protein